MLSDETSKFAVTWKTATASVIAPTISYVVGTAVGFVSFSVALLLSNQSIPLIMFNAGIAAGFAGVYAARFLCDKLLQHYSKRFVFLVMLLISVVGIAVESLDVPYKSSQIFLVVEAITDAIAAYVLLWKDEKV